MIQPLLLTVSRGCPEACRNVGRVHCVHKRDSAPLQLVGRQAAPVTIGAMYFAEVVDLAEDAPGISRFVGLLDVQVVMWTSKVDGWLSELLMNYFVWDEGKCFLANLS